MSGRKTAPCQGEKEHHNVSSEIKTQSVQKEQRHVGKHHNLSNERTAERQFREAAQSQAEKDQHNE